MSETERPERKSRTLPGGLEIHEADDCRFVSSPSRTVHERGECDGEEYDYQYHPRCGQRLPADSMWSHVDAKTPEEAILRYDLSPCTKCFNRAGRLERWRSAIHSNPAYSSPEDVPDEVLRKAGLNQHIETDTNREK